MSRKNIFFFEITPNADFSFMNEKYKKCHFDIIPMPEVIMPSELIKKWSPTENDAACKGAVSPYAITPHHADFGINNITFSSPLFKQALEQCTHWRRSQSAFAHAIEEYEDNERYSLEIKHQIIELMLICGIGTVGVTSVFTNYGSGDVIDLSEYPVIMTEASKLTAQALSDLGKSILLIRNDFLIQS